MHKQRLVVYTKHAFSVEVVLLQVVYKVWLSVLPSLNEVSGHGQESLFIQLTLENAHHLVDFQLVFGADLG